LSRRTIAVIEALFARVASICRTSTTDSFPDGLVEQLDNAIGFTLHESPGEAREHVLLGLAGVRSGLFPQSPAYQPQKAEPGIAAA